MSTPLQEIAWDDLKPADEPAAQALVATAGNKLAQKRGAVQQIRAQAAKQGYGVEMDWSQLTPIDQPTARDEAIQRDVPILSPQQVRKFGQSDAAAKVTHLPPAVPTRAAPIDQIAAQYEAIKAGGQLSKLSPEDYATFTAPLKAAGWEVGPDYIKPPDAAPGRYPLWERQLAGQGGAIPQGKAWYERTALGRTVRNVFEPLGGMIEQGAKAAGESVAGTLRGDPFAGAKALYETVGKPQVDQLQQAYEGYKQDQVKLGPGMISHETVGHALAGIVPFFGPVAASGSEKVGRGVGKVTVGDMRGWEDIIGAVPDAVMLATPLLSKAFKAMDSGVPVEEAMSSVADQLKPLLEKRLKETIAPEGTPATGAKPKIVLPRKEVTYAGERPQVQPEAGPPGEAYRGVGGEAGNVAQEGAVSGLRDRQQGQRPQGEVRGVPEVEARRRAEAQRMEASGELLTPEDFGKMTDEEFKAWKASGGKTVPPRLVANPRTPEEILHPEEATSAVPAGHTRFYRADEVNATGPQGDRWVTDPEYASQKHGAGQMGSETIWQIDVPTDALKAEYGDVPAIITNESLDAIGVKPEPSLYRRVTNAQEPTTQVLRPNAVARAEETTPSTSEGQVSQGVTNRQGERSLPTTLEAAGLTPGTDLTYDVASNPATVAKAQENLATKGVDAAAEYVRSAESPTAEHTATGFAVIRALQDAGEYTKAADVASDLSAKLTANGQAVQAVKTIAQFAPERAVVTAQKVLDASGKGKKLSPIQAERITKAAQAIEGSNGKVAAAEAKVDAVADKLPAASPANWRAKLTAAEDAARQRITARRQGQAGEGGFVALERKPKLGKGDTAVANETGKGLWSGVVDMHDGEILQTVPYKKAQAADFHHTFYIDAEHLDAMKTGEKSFFFINEKGQIRDGFGDRLPADIEARIKKQVTLPQDLRRGEAGFIGGRDVGPEGMVGSATDIADYAIVGAAKLARKGIDFATWSKEMLGEFGDSIKPHLAHIYRASFEQYTSAKRDAYQAMKERAVQKGLPPMTAEELATAVKQRDLAIKARTAATRGLAAEYEALQPGARLKREAVSALNAPRSIKASMDLSAPLRQGAVFVTEPKIAAKAFGKQLSALKQTGYERAYTEIQRSPEFTNAQAAGLEFTGSPLRGNDALSLREEAFMSRWAEKIPGVAASERAYVTYLDTLRINLFEKYAAEIRQAVKDPKAVDAELKSVASFINKATGRGDLGRYGNAAAPVLNSVFFAPRYAISRLQILNPATYTKMTPVARGIALRKMFQFTGLVGTTLALAKASGMQVGTDVESPDFLKIKVGDTRFDLLAGEQQYMRAAARLAKGFYANATGAKLKDSEQPASVAGRFARSKLAPVPSLVADLATGKTFEGEPVIPQPAKGQPPLTTGEKAKAVAAREGSEMFTPLFIKDAYDAWKTQTTGVPTKIAATAGGLLGVGVQTYANRREQAAKFKGLSLEDAAKTYREAQPSERVKLRRLLIEKRDNALQHAKTLADRRRIYEEYRQATQ